GGADDGSESRSSHSDCTSMVTRWGMLARERREAREARERRSPSSGTSSSHSGSTSIVVRETRGGAFGGGLGGAGRRGPPMDRSMRETSRSRNSPLQGALTAARPASPSAARARYEFSPVATTVTELGYAARSASRWIESASRSLASTDQIAGGVFP